MNRFAVETLEDRRLMSASALALGLNANSVTSANYKSLVTLLRESGTTSVRLWYGFGDYDSRKTARVVTWIEKFKHDGFDTTLTVSPDGGTVGTADQTTGLFNFLVSIPGLTQAVDRWEIGNEEDSSYYWKGSLKDYVGQFLAPASAVLHSVGEQVVSGGVSWNPQDVQKLVDQGMLRYVDYVGYHPYRSTYADLVNKVAQVKEIAAGKPLVATEWNVRGHENDSSPAAWAADIAKFWPVIRDNFYAAYYYAATKVNTPAGPAGVMNPDGSANDPFFSVYNSLQDTLDTGTDTGDGTTTPPVTTPTPTPIPTPTPTPAPTSTPTTGGTTGTGTGTGTSTGGGSTSTSSGKGSTGRGTTGKGTTGSGSTSGGSTSGRGTSGGKTSGGTTTGKGTTGGSTTGKGTSGGGSKGTTGGTTGGTPTPTGPKKPVPVPVLNLPKPKPKPILPTLTSIALVNADRDRVIKTEAGLTGTVAIDLSQLATNNLTFLAAVNSKVKSVKWTINGATYLDSSGAFTLYGENRRAGIVGQAFTAGSYVITAQAFGGEDATGTAAAVQTFTVNFINGKPPATTDTNAAAKAAYLKRKAARSPSFGNQLLGSQTSVLSGVSLFSTPKRRHRA